LYEIHRQIGSSTKVDLTLELADNFTLGELLFSDVAQRSLELRAIQYDPSDEVMHNLGYFVNFLLQPTRDALGVPIRVTSGYRSKALNRLINGSRRSAHIEGRAADCHLNPAFLIDPLKATLRAELQEKLKAKVKAPNANWYLFAWLVCNLKNLPIDQIIHEFGEPGQPAWVHIACSRRRKPKREVLGIGYWTRNRYVKLDSVDIRHLGE